MSRILFQAGYLFPCMFGDVVTVESGGASSKNLPGRHF